ncbi:MAG: RNA polymerase sigma factor [Kiritimatiellae bacterium]|nr:RNA polymerase sigma factor [Kiritimatiellia bacterium]MCO5061117.1 RNA polymerase sigma factor [Kiritimatiellia bacterium]MCO5067819.1 RNA polymerase sigma factor [Kiritimatiellia bacterium]
MTQTSKTVVKSDERLLATLRENMDRVYRMGLGFCGNHADAQDLVQETMLSAFRGWGRFEGRADPKTWLYRIASRVCLRMRRRRAGQPAQIESLDEDPAFAERTMVDLNALAQQGDGAFEESVALPQLRDAIVGLPAEFRVVLVLKEIGELSIEDVARILGIKPQTVKTRLYRARMRLRAQLAKKLPQTPGALPAYSRQVCLDLLRAKQDALDRGVPFPVQGALLCERCQAVFSTLDLAQDLCGRIGEGPLPPEVRKLLRTFQK